ncbi:hydrogenase maturation nickel metallochaperone HypA [bacterium]|nr:hydrogenase maturation nickel metallochaperone HypA [bacterium]
MHETAIAQSIIDTVMTHADKAGAKHVDKVEIEIGELTFLGIDQIRFWIENQIAGTVAEKAEWIFHSVPGGIRCPACQYEGDIKTAETEDHFRLPVFACPECGQANIEITQGRDAWIKAIHVEID